MFCFSKSLGTYEETHYGMENVFLDFYSLILINLLIISYARIFHEVISVLIIKITISSIVIGLKNSYFPLIHLPSCYRTVY